MRGADLNSLFPVGITSRTPHRPHIRTLLAIGRDFVDDARVSGLNAAQNKDRKRFYENGLSFEAGAGEFAIDLSRNIHRVLQLRTRRRAPI